MSRLAIAMGAILIASAVPAQEPPPPEQEQPPPSREATPEEAPQSPPSATPTAPSEPPTSAPPGGEPVAPPPAPEAHNKMIPVGPAPSPAAPEIAHALPPIQCDHQELAGTVVGFDATRLWVKENGNITLLRIDASTSIDGGHSIPGQAPTTHGFKRGDPVRACYIAQPQAGGPGLNQAVAVDGPRSYEP